MKTLGQRIKELRIRKGITQKELAEKANLNATWLSQLENDAHTPAMETLIRIAEGLGCKVVVQFVEKEIPVNEDLILFQDKDDKRF